jgi:eukaryotic-like serine/threonine-protein kinase
LSATHRLLRFGVFELNLDTEEVRKEGVVLKLGPQPFKVLVLLAGRSGQIVNREELRQALWDEETYVDFEHGLNQCIKQIRTVLNDNSSHPLYIETLPRKGYRFLAPVTSKTIPVLPKVTPSTSGVQPRISLPSANAGGGSPTSPGVTVAAVQPAAGTSIAGAAGPLETQVSREAAAAEIAAPAPSRRGKVGRIVGWLAVPALALVGILFYWHSQKASALMEKDTVVLGDFANSSGDPVFDDTLEQALRIQLEQSPFLNLVPDQKVNLTLSLMGRSVGDRLTPEVTREICQRVGGKAMLNGSIAQLGSQYVVGVKAVNCNSGDVLAEALEQAKNKEGVLKALDRAALSVRRRLGESLRTVENFATPIEEATTPSLDALKAYSLARKASREKDWAAGIPYCQRAIELDPNFALAYYELGVSYHNLSELGRATEYFTKAFELRQHASERERLTISAAYYHMATGEMDKAAQAFQQLIDYYPRDDYKAYQDFSNLYGSMGQYGKATDLARRAARMPPDRVGEYDNLINFLLASQQFGEADRVIQEAQARKLDSYYTHAATYALGFLLSDSPSMAEQQRWLASNKALEHFGLSLESDTEAYAGRLNKARELSEKAIDSAVRSDNPEGGAMWSENHALREAAFGNFEAAQQAAAAGLKLNPNSQSVQIEAALAYAMSGNAAQAEALAQYLDEKYPLDTQVQSLWLPAIRAQMALNRRNSAEAIKQLQAATPAIEYGASQSIVQNTCLYPTYIRGQAYLQTRQGTAAAAQFQKILDHSGMVWNCWTGALSHLGVARANALQSRTSQGAEADAARTRALAAYKDFLALWKDADPDIPILKQAKAEYAKLR